VTTADALISAGTAEAAVVLVPASEDVEAARETERALAL
jgi:hypothetical protein